LLGKNVRTRKKALKGSRDTGESGQEWQGWGTPQERHISRERQFREKLCTLDTHRPKSEYSRARQEQFGDKNTENVWGEATRAGGETKYRIKKREGNGVEERWKPRKSLFRSRGSKISSQLGTRITYWGGCLTTIPARGRFGGRTPCIRKNKKKPLRGGLSARGAKAVFNVLINVGERFASR